MKPLRIVSWNILHGGGSRCDQILATLEKYQPDIVTLQEFRHGRSKPVLIEGLRSLGLDAICAPETSNARENSVIVATSLAMRAESFPSVSSPARAIEACIEITAGVELNLIAVHFPQKKAQVPLFDRLLALPSEWRDENSILIGDFNCGIPFEDSETQTFYATHLFQQLLSCGWSDAWRQRNPKAREYTWVSAGKGNGFRYDHALVSDELNQRVLEVKYDHSVREQKISDHSLLLIDIHL